IVVVVADLLAVTHHRAGTDDGTANASAAPDPAAIEQQRVLDLGAYFDGDATPDHRPDHGAAAGHRAGAEQRAEGLAPMRRLARGHLRWRRAMAGADDRPSRIIEVQAWTVGAQVHVGTVVRLHAARLVPVGAPLTRARGQEIVRHHMVFLG